MSGGIPIGWSSGMHEYIITPTIIPFKTLTRKVGELKAAMTEWKMKCKYPSADDIDLGKWLTSTDLEDLQVVHSPIEA